MKGKGTLVQHSIKYNDGRTVNDAVIAIWEDLNTERPDCFRAFWVSESSDMTTGSPVVGYCSPGGSYRTIRETVADALRRYPGTPVYRNGRRIA